MKHFGASPRRKYLKTIWSQSPDPVRSWTSRLSEIYLQSRLFDQVLQAPLCNFSFMQSPFCFLWLLFKSLHDGFTHYSRLQQFTPESVLVFKLTWIVYHPAWWLNSAPLLFLHKNHSFIRCLEPQMHLKLLEISLTAGGPSAQRYTPLCLSCKTVENTFDVRSWVSSFEVAN